MKQVNLEFTGTVLQELGNSMFSVSIEIGNGTTSTIICTICGKIRKNYIRIVAGDRVEVEVSPYDLTKGRIVTRLKNESDLAKLNNNSSNKKSKKK